MTPTHSNHNSASSFHHGGYRHPQALSPIHIPNSAHASSSPRPDIATSPQAAEHLPAAPPPKQEEEEKSTHIPIPVYKTSRGNPYSSTHSFGSRGPSQRVQAFSGRDVEAESTFVPEDVKSTIPLALAKAEAYPSFDIGATTPRQTGRLSEPTPTKIIWQGNGKTVLLARAADDN